MTSAPGSSPSQRPGGEHPRTGPSDQISSERTSSAAPSRRASTTGRAPWDQAAAGGAPVDARSRGAGVPELSQHLLSVLRCPLTRGRLLVLDDHHLMSELPHLEGIHPVYEISDGIPHLLPAQGLANRSQR